MVDQTPDVLGTKGRARIVAQLLADLQEQKFRLQTMQVVNGHYDNDKVPGAGFTYEERLTKLRESEANIVATYEDQMDAVRAIAKEIQNG